MCNNITPLSIPQPVYSIFSIISSMPKGSNRPKRALGAYNFFVRDRRQYYKDKNVSINFTDFSKECSELWKGLGEAGKAKYQDNVDADKVRFQNEMASYTPESPKSRKRKSKDPNQPKRPLSGFFLFCQQVRPKFRSEDPKATLGDLAKKLGAAWRKCSEEEKAPYEDMARKDKKRYEKDMETYRGMGKKGGEDLDPADDTTSSEDKD